jgi:hypothetical protein
MGKTVLDIRGCDFYINGKPVYDEIKNAGEAKGLLMNARFIQGVFDDAFDRRRFDRFGRVFDPEENTNRLIDSLPEWYGYGLRAITVGFQGGWPVFTVDVRTINNNPFGTGGCKLDERYASRMDRIIRAADSLGIVVIVNFLYWAQSLRFKDGRALTRAVGLAANFLKNGGYTNVMIDLANEYNIPHWSQHPIINNAECIQLLIDIARKESGGLPIGSSGGGGMFDSEIADCSDIVLVHGNGLTRGEYYNFIRRVKEMSPRKPVICNEDSPCFSRIEIAKETHTSWGYYNNFTKQEPPCDWGVTPGQDHYFASRMAKAVGIILQELSFEEQFYLQGFEENTETGGQRWILLAAEYPEQIDRVKYYVDDECIYTSYDEPFFLYGKNTWIQNAYIVEKGRKFSAEAKLHNGKSVIKTQMVC